MKLKLFLSAAALVCSAGMARATNITYSISAIAAGSLGGTDFRDELVTLTMNADTFERDGRGGSFDHRRNCSVERGGYWECDVHGCDGSLR